MSTEDVRPAWLDRAVTLHDHFDGWTTMRVAEPQPQYGLVQLNVERKGVTISVDVKIADLRAALDSCALAATDPASDEALRVREVLAAHRYRDVLGDYEIKPYRKHFGCSCGWQQDIGGMSGWRSWLAAHEAHVAEQIAAPTPPSETATPCLCDDEFAEVGCTTDHNHPAPTPPTVAPSEEPATGNAASEGRECGEHMDCDGSGPDCWDPTPTPPSETATGYGYQPDTGVAHSHPAPVHADDTGLCHSPAAPEGTSDCQRRDGHGGEHRDDSGGTWPNAFAASADAGDAVILRLDRYTISVNGFRVRADEQAEARINALTPEQLRNFLAVMRGPA